MRKPRTTLTHRAAALRTLLIGPIVLTLASGCTDLGESPFSAITPDNFYQTEEEVIGGLAAVYSGLKTSLGGYYNLSEVTTDEIIVPTRGGDWFDGGRWLQLHQHTWSPTSTSAEDINGTWNNSFIGVARANLLLSVLPNVTVANKEVIEAELRTLRAFYYYILMDMFGGVPIVEDVAIMPRPRATRAEVFDFIESELLAAREVLPASWSTEMHGRVTKGVADAILASIYVNAEVFTGTVDAGGLQRGTPRWDDARDAADRILNSGEYSLASDWHANFRHDNHTSPENIFVVKNLNESGFGFDEFFLYRALHYNSGAGGAWNGFSTLAEVYYAFDTAEVQTLPVPGTTETADILISNDLRHSIFLAGQHYNVLTGEAVEDRSGVPLFFTPTIGDATAAAENEGVRIYKYPADPNYTGQWHSNDIAYFRLAEIYLIKAEALNELNETEDAIDLINIVRERVFDPDRPIASGLSQSEVREAIRRERLFELTAESRRRQDLIRYGRFNEPWSFKGMSEPYKILMPIPQTQMDANPLLEQNPGYPG
jgi:hypothetical protein